MRWHKEVQHPRITRINLTPDCGSRLVPVLYQSWIFEPLPDPGVTLTAVPLTTGAASLGSPAFSQSHSLATAGLTTGASAVGSPAITQRHTLASSGLTTGASTVGSPVLTIVFGPPIDLTAASVTTGVPTVGDPILQRFFVIVANGLTSGNPTLGSPVLAHRYNLANAGLTAGQATVGSPAIGQNHSIAAVALAAGQVVFDTPHLIQNYILQTTDLIAGSVIIGNPDCRSYPPEEWVSELFAAVSVVTRRCNSHSTGAKMIEATSSARSRGLVAATSPATHSLGSMSAGNTIASGQSAAMSMFEKESNLWLHLNISSTSRLTLKSLSPLTAPP
jgi:hypothetical protein